MTRTIALKFIGDLDQFSIVVSLIEGDFRFVTYMFVHGTVSHISFNIIIQLFLGIALETVNGSWRVAAVYLLGIAAGSMGYSVTKPEKGLIGASGGVYSLITAHIATILMNWHEMESAMMQMFVFLIVCSSNITTEIYYYHVSKDDGFGHDAHFFGAFAGLLVGIGVLRNLNCRPYQRAIWWCAVFVYTMMMIGGAVHNLQRT